MDEVFSNSAVASGALSTDELGRLDQLLDDCGCDVMSLEEVDGLFWALICCPAPILPAEFLAEIFDGDLYEATSHVPDSEAAAMIALLRRHWNSIRRDLDSARQRRIFLFDWDGEDCAQWAHGFMTGVEMRSELWAGLTGQGADGLLWPVRYFDDEDGPDQADSFEEAPPGERRKLLRRMEENLPAIYGHFRTAREKAYAETGIADVWQGCVGAPPAPLSESEMDWLDDYTERIAGEVGMAFEAIDGFFCSLIVGPKAFAPEEYLPMIFGGDMEKFRASDPQQAGQARLLLARHWNKIVTDICAGESYIPVLGEYDDGKMYANNWAIGFMRGVALGNDVWSRWLDADPQEDGPLQFLAPMLALAHEHDPNPATRTPAIKSLKKRERIIGAMVLSAMAIYFYFRPHLLPPESADAEPDSNFSARNSGLKVGRNEPCPCGSGKKHKKCCGQPF